MRANSAKFGPWRAIHKGLLAACPRYEKKTLDLRSYPDVIVCKMKLRRPISYIYILTQLDPRLFATSAHISSLHAPGQSTTCARCQSKRSHIIQRKFHTQPSLTTQLEERSRCKKNTVSNLAVRKLSSSPIDEYEERVRSGELKDDLHQRGEASPAKSTPPSSNLTYIHLRLPPRPTHHA